MSAKAKAVSEASKQHVANMSSRLLLESHARLAVLRFRDQLAQLDGELKRLYEEGLLTDEFYDEKVTECETAA